MGKLQSASEGSSCFKAGLLSSIQTKTTPDQLSGNQKQLLISSKAESFAGGSLRNGSKRAVVLVQNQNSQILQPFVSGSKTRKQMASSNRSQCSKYIFIALIHPIQWTIALPVSTSVHLPGVASCILPV